MRRPLALLAALGFVFAMASPALGEPSPSSSPTSNTEQTIVSLTFDGAFKGQDEAAQIMADHGLAGTFYINSGYINYPAYLSMAQLRTIARNRNEIGGASFYGDFISTSAKSKAAVCDDRATLAQLGFQVTSFSYPHGDSSAIAKGVAQACGYNSARDVSGLYEGPSDCASCPHANPVPPVDDFRIKTHSPGTNLARLKHYVEDAETNGGGWVPIVFTKICVCPEEYGDAMSPADFEDFITWLTTRPTTTVVRTVDQVMGGEYKPVVGKPLARLVPDPSAAISKEPDEALSHKPAWTVAGIGISQAQILMIGVPVALGVIFTWRYATRKDRYVRTHG